jgi:hypothetical protein
MKWTVATGYHCKSGLNDPIEVASAKVPQSAWVEGKCHKYRRQDVRGYVPMKEQNGWTMLGE